MLRAIMPWLDRQLSGFDIRKDITIQYPLELREAKGLASVAHGTKTEVSWQVSELHLGASWTLALTHTQDFQQKQYSIWR
jgi:hypothetical protein